ncbi:MAG: four helix bundle protein [Verrucomicrobia bacterium]|nr:four helix bundle protein [Verrucomicrobiota bacterium]
MKTTTSADLAYDLEKRTAVFGESVIEFCLGLPNTPINAPLITQFVKSATSLGANYGEADEAESKADFRHKIAICRKEAKETKHWCRMLAKACAKEADTLRVLWKESRELHLIFCKIIRTTDANLRRERTAKKAPSR